MTLESTLVISLNDHVVVDNVVRRLLEDGFSKKNLTIIGKGFHTEEKVVGFLTTSDRMMIWGRYGAFWGGLWGALFGGALLTVPLVGPVVVVGFLASLLASMFEGAVVVGAVSALVGAMMSAGIAQEHAIRYESAIKSNGFVVMVRGNSNELLQAKNVLSTFNLLSVEKHASDQVEDAIQELTAHKTPLIS